MMIEPLSARLLKTIGVGICLIDKESLAVTFCNPVFSTWFPEVTAGVMACETVDGLTPEVLQQSVTLELKTKIKRRTLIIEARVYATEHDGRAILVLECQNVSRLRETEAMIDSYVAMVERRTRDLEREKSQVEKLLLNIMPRTVYEEYKSFGSVSPRLFEPVSVVMLDFVGFTDMAVAADPTVTVAELNDIFTAFDRIGELHGCERIKTVGDCYMAVAGLPHPNPDHVRNAAQCATRMIRYLRRRNETHPHQWQARIGIASGSVVGSVVGVQKYIYDVFGPAVNYAARLQALSDPMDITVCSSFAADLTDEFHLGTLRDVTVRGFGSRHVATLHEAHHASHAA